MNRHCLVPYSRKLVIKNKKLENCCEIRCLKQPARHLSRLSGLVFILIAGLLLATTSFGAQSTADVPVSNEMKEVALKEIRGGKILQFQREDEYVIGHGDVLTVSIYEEGDMSATGNVMQGPNEQAGGGVTGTTVMMDGRVSLRDIGDVEVVGLTLTELADYLKKLYSEIYEDPILTTTLAQSNSLRYTVMGEVNSPGILPLDHPLTLVQVVAKSGGFTEWAGKEITVVRKHLKKDDKNQFKGNTLKFDYDDFVSGKKIDNNIYVRSGDIIIVD